MEIKAGIIIDRRDVTGRPIVEFNNPINGMVISNYNEIPSAERYAGATHIFRFTPEDQFASYVNPNKVEVKNE